MPAPAPAQTISEALHIATALLSSRSESPRLDAELLLAHVTGLPRARFHAEPERELPVQAGWAFQQLVKRRMQGEPIAYITGHQEFWSLPLEVSPAVLIPRPETELVVERALAHLDAARRADVLDLGTGSGAIALAIASERPHARVVAVDVSPDALIIATRNAARLQISNVQFMQGHWYQPLASDARYDLIVSNPPYVAADDPDLSPLVRRYEPAHALIAGPRGLEALKEIVSGAPVRLRPCGWLILEHGWKQSADVRALLVSAGFTHVRSHADLAGHERVTEGMMSGAGLTARRGDAVGCRQSARPPPLSVTGALRDRIQDIQGHVHRAALRRASAHHLPKLPAVRGGWLFRRHDLPPRDQRLHGAGRWLERRYEDQARAAGTDQE